MDIEDDMKALNEAGRKAQLTTNPYETNPERLPEDDPYLVRSAQYGRYAPADRDFRPRYDHWFNPQEAHAEYWREVVRLYCRPDTSLNIPGNREAYAVGSIIVRIDQDGVDSSSADRYLFLNANEMTAARKAQTVLHTLGVAVPVTYFCGTVDGKNVTVESRIPGVTLEAAWRYLSPEQIRSYKQQCSQILQCLSRAGSSASGPSYVCRELNDQANVHSMEQEREVLFRKLEGGERLCFSHNDLTRPNLVVQDDRIVGVLGWRHSGYFGHRRAKAIHQQVRVPEASFLGESSDALAWADLYDLVPEFYDEIIAKDTEDKKPLTSVKTEPSSSSLEAVSISEPAWDAKPSLTQLDGAGFEEHLTPKKIADLKLETLSRRASSSERSSPAPSVNAAPSGKRPPPKKKGTAAKKPAPKKRKLNDSNSDGVNGRRSNTPASTHTAKTPGLKKQGSVSISGSPAPETKKRGSKSRRAADDDDEEQDYSDPDQLFCICRKPDNHTWMIGCDGDCEDWFHGKCVNIHPRDADLIDKYICPNCQARGIGRTSWKPMCRLPGCRKPARATVKPPSKYCCDEHGREFMLQATQHLSLAAAWSKPVASAKAAARAQANGPLRDGHGTEAEVSHADDGVGSNDDDEDEFDCNPPVELGSRGGILTAGELKALVTGVGSVDEFRKLGDRLISPLPEEDGVERNGTEFHAVTESKKLGLDFDAKGLTYSIVEASKIDELRKKRDDLLHRQEMLTARSTFVGLVRQRGKSILERLKQIDPKGGWKDICGFDSRLAWSDDEFDEWRLSEAGKKALEEGTPEALAWSYPEATDADGDLSMVDGGDHASLTRGVCTKKRCERHKQWAKVQQQEICFEQDTLDQDLAHCEAEAKAVSERAVLRMWAEKDGIWAGA